MPAILDLKIQNADFLAETLATPTKSIILNNFCSSTYQVFCFPVDFHLLANFH